MIVILLISIFTFLSSFSFGLVTQKVLGRLASAEPNASIALTSVTGLISLTILLSYCSLFFPIDSIWLQSAIGIFTIACIGYYRTEYQGVWNQIKMGWRETDMLSKIFLVVFSLFILIKASGQVQSLDSGSYHLPFIKWVEAHKVITGLANVHSRFGFNYHYHILYAFYGFANIFGTTIHGLNGYLFFIGFIYFFSLYRDKESSPLFKIAAVIAMLYISQINKGMTGFSPDFPVAIIQMIIVFECLKFLTRKKEGNILPNDQNYFLLSIFWIAFGAITLKLATVSVLFVVLIALFRKIFNPKTLIQLVLFAVIIFTPYFVRNYFISGYAIYPFYTVDLFNVPWKVPLARTIDEKIVIKNYALGYPYYYTGAYHYNAALFKTWWKNLSYLNKAYPPVVLIIVVCLAAMLIKWIASLFSANKQWVKEPENIILYGLLAGLIFWFLNAPDLRFGNGIILPFIAIVLAEVLIFLRFTKWIKPFSMACIAIIILSSVLSLSGMALSQTTYQSNNLNFNYVIQEKYPQPDTTAIMVDGYKSYQGTTRCWECPLPCSYTVDSFNYVEPGNIEKGFKPKANR